MKTKIILVALVVLAALYGAAVWGHKNALRQQSVLDGAVLFIMEEQWKCYVERDWDCFRLVTAIANENEAMRWRPLIDAGLVGEPIIDKVTAYLDWQMTLPDSSSIVAEISAKKEADALNDGIDPISQVIRITPHFSDGQLQGYRAYPGEDTTFFRSAGLVPGDLIVAIDGDPVTMESMRMALSSLRNGQSIVIKIEKINRPGVFEDVTLSLEGQR